MIPFADGRPAFDEHMALDPCIPADLHVLADDGIRSYLHVVRKLGFGVYHCRWMDLHTALLRDHFAGAFLSTIMAIISASATIAPSTLAVPLKVLMGPRSFASSSSN